MIPVMYTSCILRRQLNKTHTHKPVRKLTGMLKNSYRETKRQTQTKSETQTRERLTQANANIQTETNTIASTNARVHTFLHTNSVPLIHSLLSFTILFFTIPDGTFVAPFLSLASHYSHLPFPRSLSILRFLTVPYQPLCSFSTLRF